MYSIDDKFKHNTACPWGCCYLGLASKASEQLDGAVPMVCTVVNIILFNGILTILVTFSLWMDTCAYLSVDLPWGHNMYCSCRSHSELTMDIIMGMNCGMCIFVEWSTYIMCMPIFSCIILIASKYYFLWKIKGKFKSPTGNKCRDMMWW